MKKVISFIFFTLIVMQGCSAPRTNVAEVAKPNNSKMYIQVVDLNATRRTERTEKGLESVIIGLVGNALTSYSKSKIKDFAKDFSRSATAYQRFNYKEFDLSNKSLLAVYRIVTVDDRGKELENVPTMAESCAIIQKPMHIKTKKGNEFDFKINLPICNETNSTRQNNTYIHYYALFSVEQLIKDEVCTPFEIKLLNYAYPALLSKAAKNGWFMEIDDPKSTLTLNISAPQNSNNYFKTGDLVFDTPWTGKHDPQFKLIAGKKYDDSNPTFCSENHKVNLTVVATLKDKSGLTEKTNDWSEDIDFKEWIKSAVEYFEDK